MVINLIIFFLKQFLNIYVMNQMYLFQCIQQPLVLYTGIHGENGKWPTNPRCDKLSHLQRRKSNKRETKTPGHQNVVINSIKTGRHVEIRSNMITGQGSTLITAYPAAFAVYLNKFILSLKKKSTIAVNINRLNNTIKRHIAGQGGSHPILVIVRLKQEGCREFKASPGCIIRLSPAQDKELDTVSKARKIKIRIKVKEIHFPGWIKRQHPTLSLYYEKHISMNTNMQEWVKIFCVTTERKKADTSYVQCRKLESDRQKLQGRGEPEKKPC